MKSIISIFAAAALLLSALTACGTNTRTMRREEARTTPSPAATATTAPAATAAPDRNGTDTGIGGAIGDAARGAGDAVGDAVRGAGDAVGDIVNGAGNAVEDMTDGMGSAADGTVTDRDGYIGNETDTRR